MDGPAIATTARRERGLAAMLLLLRVDLPRAVPATATRAEREDAMTVDILADAMMRGRRMLACVGGAASAVVTAVASVRQTVKNTGRRAGGRLKKARADVSRICLGRYFVFDILKRFEPGEARKRDTREWSEDLDK